MVIHTGEKQYKCEVCGQEFSVNSSYTRHMRIHSGEKPYKCTTCGKDFRSGGTLKQHMVKHTGARNFICEVCGSSFSLRHHYTAHWKLHSGDMPIKCKVCSISFRNYSALRHHRKKNHPKEEANRLKNLKMKMMRVDEIKVKPKPKVVDPSIDVLQQAMAAAVESVNYECVDSYTQTLPVNVGTSDSIVSKIIADKLASKDSVVLAITDIQEEEIEKVDTVSNSRKYIQQTLSNELGDRTHASIVHSVDVSDGTASTLRESEEKSTVHYTNENSLHSSFYNGDGVDSARDFIVVNNEGEPMPDLKPENVKVVQTSNEDTSPMYIVLSDIQAQDSQLYIVLDKDAHVSG
nr:zinc finger and BTB domain-containing protein 24-like [Penaeus vannamei]